MKTVILIVAVVFGFFILDGAVLGEYLIEEIYVIDKHYSGGNWGYDTNGDVQMQFDNYEVVFIDINGKTKKESIDQDQYYQLQIEATYTSKVLKGGITGIDYTRRITFKPFSYAR